MSHEKKHPELLSDEVFLMNTCSVNWEILKKWKTKRVGLTAYNVHDNPIPGMFPVFVKREEYEKKR